MDLFQTDSDHAHSDSSDNAEIYSVSELNRILKDLVTDHFPLLWIEGEVSNLARPGSGHWYFSLKDRKSQARCVMFRMRNRLVNFDLENGTQILARVRVSVYEPRGDLQLIVEHMEAAGHGSLQRQFEETKSKLQSEGLFDEANKQALPLYPRRLAIITSPSGAAIKDFLKVIRRRYRKLHIDIYSVLVQGDSAAPQINDALRSAYARKDLDVIALIRGGGSLEDLWAFNDKTMARLIAQSEIPIVTGIGHEIDHTIADFAADLRAPTPSAAAELITPDSQKILAALAEQSRRLANSCRDRIQNQNQRLDWSAQRLYRKHPSIEIRQKFKTLQNSSYRLRLSAEQQFGQYKDRYSQLQTRLRLRSPANLVQTLASQMSLYSRRLNTSAYEQLNRKTHRFALATNTLNAVSPLNTLDRGYSIVLANDKQTVINEQEQAQRGDIFHVQLKRGQLTAEVTETSPEPILDLRLPPVNKPRSD